MDAAFASTWAPRQVGRSIKMLIPVQYTNGDAQPVARVSFADFESSGNAQPTSRMLDGSLDHGFAQEWIEPGHITIDGERRPARLVYLFSDADCRDEAADYPWDAAHAARILLAD